MQLEIEQFLNLNGPMYDVRSPIEFEGGHIPSALTLPLFTNEERALVGTCYKKEGHEKAFLLALELVSPKMALLAIEGLKTRCERTRVYCARGGLRSSSMEWLFNTAKVPTVSLKGGYKAFRNFVLKQLSLPYSFTVISGLTGSGKTEYLHKLKANSSQVIDLEDLANNRGSAFGHLGREASPTNEHFENLIAMELRKFDLTKPIYIEDESRMVGPCKIPDGIYAQMKVGEKEKVEASKEERIERLYREYGSFSKEELIFAVKKIEKRLGGKSTKEAIEKISLGEIKEAIEIVLSYYDRAYLVPS